MDTPLAEPLPPAQAIAVAHTPRALRAQLESALWLDRRLGHIVGQATEPILAQMRLAWWRDQLSTPANQRPQGDPLLDHIGREWPGKEAPLIQLIDGWEAMLAEPPLRQETAELFALSRAAPFKAMVDSSHREAGKAAIKWALADAAAHCSDEKERALLVEWGLRAGSQPARLPRELRGLAILEALAIRSLLAGGVPLMEGRGAAATAFRVGLLGR